MGEGVCIGFFYFLDFACLCNSEISDSRVVWVGMLRVVEMSFPYGS